MLSITYIKFFEDIKSKGDENMQKAVIIGFSHMHVNEVALYLSEQPEFTLVGAADVESSAERIPPYRYTPLWNLENVRENYCNVIYDDYRRMLDELKPNIAFILSENIQKPEIVEECAKRGVDVCIEKPIAVSLDEAKKIQASVEKYNINAVVNWPVLWRGYVHKMKAAIDSGVVGKPLKLRYINGHTGPLGKGAKHRGVTAQADEMSDADRAKTWWHRKSNGGGVFLDISCYGCLFARWFLGNDAESAYAYGTNLNTPFGDTEDNFAGIIKYKDRMAVIEGTWTTPRVVIPSGPMMICTNGVITCTGGAENNPDVKAFDIYGNEVELPDFPANEKYKNMPCHLAACKKSDEPIHEMLTLNANVEVMAMMDALINSSDSCSEVQISE